MTETVKGGSRSRILVIDDDAALAEMLSIVLRNEGFEPIWCAHGDKASEPIAIQSPTWCCWT